MKLIFAETRSLNILIRALNSSLLYNCRSFIGLFSKFGATILRATRRTNMWMKSLKSRRELQTWLILSRTRVVVRSSVRCIALCTDIQNTNTIAELVRVGIFIVSRDSGWLMRDQIQLIDIEQFCHVIQKVWFQFPIKVLRIHSPIIMLNKLDSSTYWFFYLTDWQMFLLFSLHWQCSLHCDLSNCKSNVSQNVPVFMI